MTTAFTRGSGAFTGTTWFTSDLHFGHQNIIAYCRRPFHSVPNMNKLLVMNWNEVVAPEDRVFVMGDVAMGKLAETLPIVGQLNGTKVLVPGNHDRCWTGHRKTGTWGDKYVEAGFFGVLENEVPLGTIFGMDRDAVTGCHFPFSGDSHDEDRYSDHRPIDRGQWLIHGHVHNAWKQQGRMINVGVDVWDYYPAHIDDIRKLMADEALLTGAI